MDPSLGVYVSLSSASPYREIKRKDGNSNKFMLNGSSIISLYKDEEKPAVYSLNSKIELDFLKKYCYEYLASVGQFSWRYGNWTFLLEADGLLATETKKKMEKKCTTIKELEEMFGGREEKTAILKAYTAGVMEFDQSLSLTDFLSNNTSLSLLLPKISM